MNGQRFHPLRLPEYDDPFAVYDGDAFYDEEPQQKTKKAMAKILRNWDRKNRNDRSQFFDTIITNLGKTPAPLAAPNPPLAAMNAAQTQSKASLQLVKDLLTQLEAARLQADADLDAVSALVGQQASTAESQLGDDVPAIVAIGYEVSGAQPAPAPGPLTQVSNLSLSAGDNESEVDASWDRKPGATSYHTRYTYDITKPDGWVAGPESTKSKVTITGLTSGKRVWVQVRGFGPKGPGPWSDEASKMVP